MQNKDNIKNELEIVKSFYNFVQLYQEISVMRMQRIRQRVLRNRFFQEQLMDIYYHVKHSYENEVIKIEMNKKNKFQSPSGISHEKNLSVLLTANGRMYGSIFQQVFAVFRGSIFNKKTDLMIVGRVGKQLFESSGLKLPYHYFELPDREVKYDDLFEIINLLLTYENIDVYYARFENIVIQKPTTTNITGEMVDKIKTDLRGKKTGQSSQIARHFLFEPSLADVLHFFDTQVFASFFKQSIHESDLARFAARIQAMEKAGENITQRISRLKIDLKRADKLLENKKQIERLSGMAIWNT